MPEEGTLLGDRAVVVCSRVRLPFPPPMTLIVLTTRSLVDHLSDDAEVLEGSRLLKDFAESFCMLPIPVTLGYRKGGSDMTRPGLLRPW